MAQSLWKTVTQYTKLPSNAPPLYLPKKNENTHVHKDLNINVYHNFNIIAARWKELNCSSTGGWVKTLYTFIQGTTMKHMKKDKYSSINEVQCMQVRKQQLELDMEQQTGSK